MPMHGNDIIATRPKAAGGVTVMKGESKSAATMSRNTITGAAEGLEQPRLFQPAGIEPEQHVGTAAQIQAKIDLFAGQPAGHILKRLTRHEIRRGIDKPGHTEQDNQNNLPAFEIEHPGLFRLPEVR
jgi:hypothetical protein